MNNIVSQVHSLVVVTQVFQAMGVGLVIASLLNQWSSSDALMTMTL